VKLSVCQCPRNVRKQKQKQKHSKKTTTPPTAAVLLADSTPLPPEIIINQISLLPPSHQADAMQVCRQEPADLAGKLAALQQFGAALAAGKAAGAGWLRQAIRQGWAAAPALQQQQALLQQQEEEAWEWWQGLPQDQQAQGLLEHQYRLMGVRGLTDRRKALILYRLINEQREAA